MFFEVRLFPLDYAADALIIKEAGRIVGTLFADKINYFKPCAVLAANSEPEL